MAQQMVNTLASTSSLSNEITNFFGDLTADLMGSSSHFSSIMDEICAERDQAAEDSFYGLD